MPKVSVIMPVHNSEDYLREAIDSILNQTFTDFEFIIIDDGSSDHSQEIVKSYFDSRIRFYINAQNMGVAATLNRGLELATGEYVARMDSDDISLPERFEKQVSYMDTHQKVAVCATGVRLFGAQNGERVFSATNAQLKVDLLFNNCFAHPTVMMRRSVVGGKCKYNEAFSAMEDYALWVEVSREYELATIEDVLVMYRVHQSQVTQNQPKDYLEQEKLLKYKLLSELGMANEKNVATLVSQRGALSSSEKRDYISLLTAIVKSNCNKSIYDERCLRNTVASIITGILGTFPIQEAAKLAHANGINGTKYALERIMRGAIYRAQKDIKRVTLRIRLRNKNFTIISNNCWGGFIYQKYGLEYRTPTIGLYFLGDDYVKFCASLDEYLSRQLAFIPWESSRFYPELKDVKPYPVGKLGDIEVYFMHYHSEEEAREKWERRKSRINKERILFKLSQRECCSKEDVEKFMALPYKNKICFAYDKVPGAIYVPELRGFSGDEQPIVTPYLDDLKLLNGLK